MNTTKNKPDYFILTYSDGNWLNKFLVGDFHLSWFVWDLCWSDRHDVKICVWNMLHLDKFFLFLWLDVFEANRSLITVEGHGQWYRSLNFYRTLSFNTAADLWQMKTNVVADLQCGTV